MKREYLDYITSKESKLMESQYQQKALDILKKKHEATPRISQLKLAEIELQQKLSLAHQAKYRQKVTEAKQQAELQQKVSEARQLEQKLSQGDSRSVPPAQHAELQQRVSEARVLQKKISAQKQTDNERRASEERHMILQNQLSEIRQLRQQLSKVRQTDLRKKFMEAKHAELKEELKNVEQEMSVAAQANLEQTLSESRRIMIEEELKNNVKKQNELQRILKETLLAGQQDEKPKRKFVYQPKMNASEQTFLPTRACYSEMQRSHSAPKSSQKWLMFADDISNVKIVEDKGMQRKPSSEKAVQTSISQPRKPRYCEISSSSTAVDSSSTDERTQYGRNLGGVGPTSISPRPPSAHPKRRPDLYPRHRQYHSLQESMTWGDSMPTTAGSSSAALQSSAKLLKDKSYPTASERRVESGPVTASSDSRLPSSSRQYSMERSRDGIRTGAENSTISDLCYSSSHEKKISFMVSLPMGDEKREVNASEVSVVPATSSDSMFSLTDENMRPSSRMESSVVESSKAPSPQEIIDTARETSSIIGHVDSLILMEQGMPEAPLALSAEESKEVIEKVQAESCIVQHVDSLILIEQSLHQLNDDKPKVSVF